MTTTDMIGIPIQPWSWLFLPYHPDMVEKLDGIADEARKDLGDALYNMPGENRRQTGRISR